MSDSARIVFPDELAEAETGVVDAAAADKTSGGDSNTVEKAPKELCVAASNGVIAPTNYDNTAEDENPQFLEMSDSDCIVFPDELAEAKADVVDAAAAADKTSGGDSNTVEKAPKELCATPRNVVIAPTNCDNMANNGKRYEVHDDKEFA